MKRILALIMMLLASSMVRVFAEQKLSAREAAQHVGEQAMVCDVVSERALRGTQ